VKQHRRTLGWRLGWAIGISSAVGLACSVAVVGLIWWLSDERSLPQEQISMGRNHLNVVDHPVADANEENDDPAEELAEQLLLALLIAAPVGVLAAVSASRWLTNKATRRIDAVIAVAARIDAQDLSARLAVTENDDELDDLSQALNLMFDRIATGVAAQSRFAADASHELRTPLSAMRAVIDVALTRPRSVEQWRTAAQKVNSELIFMSGLVETLLQLARLGNRDAPNARFDVVQICQDVISTLQATAEQRKIRLVLKAVNSVSLLGHADECRLALHNLLRNAISYSPNAGEVRIEIIDIGPAIELIVEDDGPGIPLSDRGRIFNAFARGAIANDRSDNQGRSGQGLGLSIVRRAAQANGGEVTVASAVSGGARFVVRWPKPSAS
jgi:two-component system, OmpR family, sensor kinase